MPALHQHPSRLSRGLVRGLKEFRIASRDLTERIFGLEPISPLEGRVMVGTLLAGFIGVILITLIELNL